MYIFWQTFWLLIAERLSVRHIIVQARRALVGSKSELVFVCVRYGFTTEIYGFYA